MLSTPADDAAKRRSQWLTVKAVVWAFLLLVVLPSAIWSGFNALIYVNRVEVEIISIADGCYLDLEWRRPEDIHRHNKKGMQTRPERRSMACDELNAFQSSHSDWWSEGGSEMAKVTRVGTFYDYTLRVPYNDGEIDRVERRFDAQQRDFLGRNTVFVRALEWPTQDILVVNDTEFIRRPLQWFLIGFIPFAFYMVMLGFIPIWDSQADLKKFEHQQRPEIIWWFWQDAMALVAMIGLALFSLNWVTKVFF